MINKKYRIAFLCFSSALGGLELTIINLAKSFQEKGDEVFLIIPPSTPLAEHGEAGNIKLEYIKPKFKYFDLLAAFQLIKILIKYRINCIFIMQSKDIHYASIAKLFYHPVKLVFYQQMQSSINKKDAFHTWTYSKLSLWISLTNRMKKDVIAHTKVPEKMIMVVPLGEDVKRFNPQNFDRLQSRKYFNLPFEKKLVGVLGRLDIKKGQEIFLKSIPRVTKLCPEVHFVIAGEETRGQEGYKEKLQQLCKKLKIESFVTFLPFTNEVPRFLSSLDVFVLPSDEETFGLVVLEAMAMEKAVIATDAGGVPEIISDGKNGLLIPPKDSIGLSNALIRVLNDSDLSNHISLEARKSVVRDFDFKKCVDKLDNSIQSILAT